MESTIVILGVTGDLARKKIIPAIYNLILHKKLKNFAIIGVARSKHTKTELINKSKEYIKGFDKNVWNKIKERFTYLRADFNEGEKVCKIGKNIREIEKKYNLKEDRIFYLATLPDLFIPIASTLNKCGLTNKKDKIVFEKPFGNNLKSAVEINKEIRKWYSEESG